MPHPDALLPLQAGTQRLEQCLLPEGVDRQEVRPLGSVGHNQSHERSPHGVVGLEYGRQSRARCSIELPCQRLQQLSITHDLGLDTRRRRGALRPCDTQVLEQPLELELAEDFGQRLTIGLGDREAFEIELER